ncbi:DUF1173 family protein [Desertibacillus haloalkaliphilus]|uniref:DUF1173 family protein n=1 Tax=Desertibacillus haloalkaliphilus TaxID=1328930 RepID=UPI001C27C45D|nr:DUF1173 family protein [Desertibacillus haloalkaliphilus]MBU8908111.1 DUF1173 domain-containing protein [Desertibacillus haloalkaliphilus]
MEVRVDNEVIELSGRKLNEIKKLYQQWHTSNRQQPAIIECLCRGRYKKNNPKLHVMKSKTGKYVLRNNPNNQENGLEHDFTCTLAIDGFHNLAHHHGIKIDDEQNIECRMNFKKKKASNKSRLSSDPNKSRQKSGSSITFGNSSLHTLFYTLLQQQRFHQYRPRNRREVVKYLYASACRTTVNKEQLKSMIFIANQGFNVGYRQKLLIGWGSKEATFDRDESHNFLVKIPLFNLDNHEEFIDYVRVPDWKYKEALDSCRIHVKQGYWVIWRDYEHKDDRFLKVEKVIFVPAESDSKIPVESSYEEAMIQYLVKKRRHFLKPLIGNVTNMFLDERPDMVLYDTNPQTIIEVAGMKNKDGYQKKLKQKADVYQKRGYRYLEWDGAESIETLFNK